MTRLLATDRDSGNRGNARLTDGGAMSGTGSGHIEANSRCRFEGRSGFGLSDARRSAYGPKTDMCPIRLATTILVPEEQARCHSLHSRHRRAAADPGPLIRRASLGFRMVKSSILERNVLRIGDVFAL